MEFKHSRRAKILEEVLQYIDNGDWERRDGFLIFGKEQFQIATGELIDDNPQFQPDPSLATKAKLNRGERIVAARTTLGPLPEDRTVEHILEWMLSLPKEVRDAVTASLESHPQQFAGSTAEEVEAEAIDSYLAWKALRTLDQSFDRVETLDEVEIGLSPVPDAKYFEEAHGCEQAGFRIATAVLCGAMLETALKQVVDPRGKIKRRVEDVNRSVGRAGKKMSHVEEMIDEAAKRYLIDDRPDCAKEIHLARNAAVHDLSKFERDYESKVARIVDNWRKVLIDLYADPRSGASINRSKLLF